MAAHENLGGQFRKQPLEWEENDGSLPHALLQAKGVGFDAYTIYDAVSIDFGDDADLMRGMLKKDAPTHEVEFPNGERKRYKGLSGARKAAERHHGVT